MRAGEVDTATYEKTLCRILCKLHCSIFDFSHISQLLIAKSCMSIRMPRMNLIAYDVRMSTDWFTRRVGDGQLEKMEFLSL